MLANEDVDELLERAAIPPELEQQSDESALV